MSPQGDALASLEIEELDMTREMSAGWYTLRDGSMRYWNGLTWTAQTPPPGTDGAAPKKAHHKHWWQRK